MVRRDERSGPPVCAAGRASAYSSGGDERRSSAAAIGVALIHAFDAGWLRWPAPTQTNANAESLPGANMGSIASLKEPQGRFALAQALGSLAYYRDGEPYPNPFYAENPYTCKPFGWGVVDRVLPKVELGDVEELSLAMAKRVLGLT